LVASEPAIRRSARLRERGDSCSVRVRASSEVIAASAPCERRFVPAHTIQSSRACFHMSGSDRLKLPAPERVPTFTGRESADRDTHSRPVLPEPSKRPRSLDEPSSSAFSPRLDAPRATVSPARGHTEAAGPVVPRRLQAERRPTPTVFQAKQDRARRLAAPVKAPPRARDSVDLVRPVPARRGRSAARLTGRLTESRGQSGSRRLSGQAHFRVSRATTWKTCATRSIEPSPRRLSATRPARNVWWHAHGPV